MTQNSEATPIGKLIAITQKVTNYGARMVNMAWHEESIREENEYAETDEVFSSHKNSQPFNQIRSNITSTYDQPLSDQAKLGNMNNSIYSKQNNQFPSAYNEMTSHH